MAILTRGPFGRSIVQSNSCPLVLSAVPEWNSCFVHKKLGLFLVVYVDDFLLSGPCENLEAAWTQIRSVVKLGKQGPLAQFLGCGHVVSPAPIPQDPGRVEIAVDMRKYLEQAIESFCSLSKFSG